jgi:hypothetical protein
MTDQVLQQTVTIDEAEQDKLWSEVEELATEISWGKFPWDFVKEAREDFFLVRKPHKEHPI